MKKAIIIILLVVALFIPLFVFDFSSEEKKLESDNNLSRENKSEDKEWQSLAYDQKAEIFLSELGGLARQDSQSKEAVGKLKQEVLSAKVPSEYKDFHLRLLLAINDYMNYIESSQKSFKNSVEEFLEQNKNFYF